MQAETRRQRQFAETETSLQNVVLTKGLLSGLSPQSLLSRLGPLNPMISPIKSDDIVWLFDNTAYIPQAGAAGTATMSKFFPLGRISRSIGKSVGPKLETTMGSWGYFPPTNGEWAAEFSFAVFEKGVKCNIVDVVAEIARKVGLADDQQDMQTIEERLTPFLLDVRPARDITVKHGGLDLKLGPTGSSGIATNGQPVRADKDDDGLVKGQAVVPAAVTGILSMHTYFAGPDGWGVISGMFEVHVLLGLDAN